MKPRNPWIDPRVAQVQSKAAQAYLVQHGWKPLAASRPSLLPFAGPKAGTNPPIVHVPLREQARDYSQRVIEFVTDLALAEGRYAVEVLDELLQAARYVENGRERTAAEIKGSYEPRMTFTNEFKDEVLTGSVDSRRLHFLKKKNPRSTNSDFRLGVPAIALRQRGVTWGHRRSARICGQQHTVASTLN